MRRTRVLPLTGHVRTSAVCFAYLGIQFLRCKSRDLSPILQVEPFEYLRHVVFDCALGDANRIRHLPVRLPGGDERQDLHLPGR